MKKIWWLYMRIQIMIHLIVLVKSDHWNTFSTVLCVDTLANSSLNSNLNILPQSINSETTKKVDQRRDDLDSSL
jgi:hypothetical protein